MGFLSRARRWLVVASKRKKKELETRCTPCGIFIMSKDSGDEIPRLPDANQKAYRYHRLIEHGQFKGCYEPLRILGLAKPAVREQFEESVDILNSGFSLYQYDSNTEAFKVIAWPSLEQFDKNVHDGECFSSK